MSTKYYYEHKNDPEFQAKRRANLRAFRRRNPDQAKAIAKRSYDKRKEELGRTCPTGSCPICLKVKKLVWDHDHDSGNFRGWICRSCNAALGFIGDNYAAVRRLTSYLQLAIDAY